MKKIVKPLSLIKTTQRSFRPTNLNLKTEEEVVEWEKTLHKQKTAAFHHIFNYQGENLEESQGIQYLSNNIGNVEDFVGVLKDTATWAKHYEVHGYQEIRALNKKPVIRVAVTGAAGNIGYSLIPRIASGEVFGDDQPVILHLIEIPEALKMVEGVAMEIQDSAFPLVRDIVITSDVKVGFKDLDYAFLVGAKPRGKGMERKDLLQDNGGIFTIQGKALNDYAKTTCKTLVVGNPANTNCLIASSHAPKIPKENFTAMTKLDHNRALNQIALKLNTSTTQLNNICIWGNHSSTQVPDLSHAFFSDKKVSTLVDQQWIDKTFIPKVQNRGAEIISVRESSSAFSAADAAIQHMKEWVFGTNGKWTSMAIPSDGSYGIPKGIFCSFPVVCLGNGKYKIVEGLKIDDAVKKRIEASVKELQEEKSTVASKMGSNVDK